MSLAKNTGLLALILLVGCKEPLPETQEEELVIEDTGEEGCLYGTDSDEDGLDDCDELELGTALHLADTDGDGFSDYREVVELGFSPENNNFKFNPLVADTPRIEVEITSPPSLALLYESSSGTELSHEVERSTGSSNTVTTGKESTNSHAVEYSTTVGASVTTSASAGFPGGFSGSVEATVSYESSLSTSSETSLSFSEEQSQENSQGYAEAEALAQSEGTTVTGGVIAVTVDVQNTGDIAYTLSNLALSAYMSTPGEQQILSPVGTLSFDTTQNTFPEFSYGPGQVNGPMVFLNDGLDTGTAQSLLTDATNLHLRVVAYELTDADGRSFTHNQTDIAARTATIIVDYEGEDTLLDSERYQVATNVDRDALRVTAWDAMTEILKLPYEMDDNRELLSVRDVANSDERNGYWTTVHASSDGLTDTVSVMNPDSEDYDFGKIELKSGDVLHLVYVEDNDRDGLGRRQEKAYGTDLELADTDGDGLLDGEEVNVYKTSPLIADSDGDGLSDGQEVLELGSNPLALDSDGDCLSDEMEIFGLGTDPAVEDSGGCRVGLDDSTFSGTTGTFRAFNAAWNTTGSHVTFAEPGEALSLAFDYEIVAGSCSGTCYNFLYTDVVLLADGAPEGEMLDSLSFDYVFFGGGSYSSYYTDRRSESGSETFELTAPDTPGLYYVADVNEGTHYTSGGSYSNAAFWPSVRDFSEAMATIVVREPAE